jgi:hypothetical protein
LGSRGARLPELYCAVLDVEFEAKESVWLPACVEYHPPTIANEWKPKPSQLDDRPFPTLSGWHGVIPHHHHYRRGAVHGKIPIADTKNVIPEILQWISQILVLLVTSKVSIVVIFSFRLRGLRGAEDEGMD